MKEKLAEEAAKRKFPELEHIINNHLTDVRKIWRDGFEAGWEAKEASIDKPSEQLAEEAQSVLSLLVELHKYKTAHGKDDFYEMKKVVAWERAYRWLDALELNSPLTKGEG